MPTHHVPTSPPISLIFILPLIAFWLWMFSTMLQNDDMPQEVKDQSTVWFVVANVFAAAMYFATVYRNRR